MKIFGLLGKKLVHSYSPQIHAQFGNYIYKLFECSEENLESFIRNGQFNGLNVTIPYKKEIIKFCDELSPIAQKIGSVNTIIRHENGNLYGDNSDFFGFSYILDKSGVSVADKKTLVLGNGGASAAVCEVLSQRGANVTVISRNGKNNYDNISQHMDAKIIVNTTPVGMYPNNGDSLINLEKFLHCECVFDIIYNPNKTKLLLQAEKLNIKHIDGFAMLVAQAKYSSELFQNHKIDAQVIEKITRKLSFSMQNIVLIGMPGCGKSTISKLLHNETKRICIDSDLLIERQVGCSISEIFVQNGEETFRNLESKVLEKLGKQSAQIIATGGGSVLREQNYLSLHQNGIIFWLQRDTKKLLRDGRPISLKRNMDELFMQRQPLYYYFADYIIDNNGTPEQAVKKILEVIS